MEKPPDNPFVKYKSFDAYFAKVGHHLESVHHMLDAFVTSDDNKSVFRYLLLAAMITVHDDLHNRQVHYQEVKPGL
jgi:hypothetical protein